MNTRSTGQEATTPYSEPECFIHHTKKKKKRRNPFIPIENQIPKVNYPPFEKLFEALVVFNLFLDLPFPMADDQPMWGNNRAVAPTSEAAIVAVDLGDNFTVKGHHLSMIKDQQFDGRTQADPHKHIVEFIKICGMFRYGTTNADAIKLKLFPSSLAGDAKEVLKMKKPTMTTEVIEEDDIEETTMVGVPEIGETVNQEMKTGTRNLEKTYLALPEKKFDKSDLEKTMREFMVAQKSSNDLVKNQFFNFKTKVEQGQKNHQASIQDLETKFG
ncbi:hypothetical protein Tco_0873152 [Tanacetum coccineum]